MHALAEWPGGARTSGGSGDKGFKGAEPSEAPPSCKQGTASAISVAGKDGATDLNALLVGPESYL